jgi:pyruvate/2-oxoglutarate/acetoin dehydrogenase E1 component
MTTVLQALNDSLHQILAANQGVIILGEDVLDPYGGAFKVTRGLSTAFPEQVITTPVSEAGIVGVAAGMALRGLRPVVEIMFGDFITLAADQLVNHIAKFAWMYNNQVRVPIVVRTPMGGRRGYGPTHSQTLEKLFLGVPGLTVLAPCSLQFEGTKDAGISARSAGSSPHGPGGLLTQAILEVDDPVLFIENKLLYLSKIVDPDSQSEFELTRAAHPSRSTSPHFVTYILTVRDAPSPALTLVSYGYMAELSRFAIRRLAYEDEIFVEMVVPTRLAPVELEPILDSVHRTGHLLTVEEGNLTLGWGAEIVAGVVELSRSKLKSAQRLAAKDLPIPASGPLEEVVLPGVDEIVQTVRRMV